MPYISLNPATNETLKTYTSWNRNHLAEALEQTYHAQPGWARLSFPERAELMHRAASLLHERAAEYAILIAAEMGKPVREGRAEVEKCALACDYYAVHAEHFMQVEMVQTGAGKSYVSYEPLGVVLGVMPWNFPFFSGDPLRRPHTHGGKWLRAEACIECSTVRPGARTAVPGCRFSPAPFQHAHDRVV